MPFESAFPLFNPGGADTDAQYGISRREYLSALMLSGSLAGVHSPMPKDGHVSTTVDPYSLVRQAIQYADELIKQLDR